MLFSSHAGAMHSQPSATERETTSITPVHSGRLFSYERRIRVWLVFLAFGTIVPAALLLHRICRSDMQAVLFTCLLTLLYAVLANIFLKQLLRPLQTLANIIAAIREEDYSFRARGGQRGDVVGDLTLEINALSGTLQVQRGTARDALSLLERVVTSMHSPVLAFDANSRLRVLNTAASHTFTLDPIKSIGHTAAELQLEQLFDVPDQGLYSLVESAAQSSLLSAIPKRWSVRRAGFRLHGLPHTLLVLSDVAAVLREEERLAWQRLIRVLSHEINNSLTPIKSIAGSLRSRMATVDPADREDFERGLSVIEDRAASLNSFLQAYQQMTHLPDPHMQFTGVRELVTRTASLETRMKIDVVTGQDLSILCDPDQVQQALINLLQNAVDAALAAEAQQAGHPPSVRFSWIEKREELCFVIEDNGLGIQNPANLFVPFYTTKPKGSGIGLALAQEIATAHRGRVTVASRPGARGCVATLTLMIDAPNLSCRRVQRDLDLRH